MRERVTRREISLHSLTAARLGGSAAVWSLIARQEGGMGREVEEEEEEEEEEESGGWLQ